MANKLDQLQKKLESFDINKTLNKVATKPNNEKLMQDLIRKRLLEKGEDAEGKQLRTFGAIVPNVYSIRTMIIKDEKGQPTDRVTLKDTGDFHESFSLKTEPEQFINTGDENKPDGKISDNLDLTNVLGLSDRERKEWAGEILPDIRLETLEAIRL